MKRASFILSLAPLLFGFKSVGNALLSDSVTNLTAEEFRQLLIQKNACAESFLLTTGKDLDTFWNTCERGDYLLWLLLNFPNKHTEAQFKSIENKFVDIIKSKDASVNNEKEFESRYGTNDPKWKVGMLALMIEKHLSELGLKSAADLIRSVIPKLILK